MSFAADRGAAIQLKGSLEDASARLSAAGVDSPRLDAELLFAFAAGVTRQALFTNSIVLDDALRNRYVNGPTQHRQAKAGSAQHAVQNGLPVLRTSKELAQNGRGIKRATRMSSEFLCCLVARSRALCTLK